LVRRGISLPTALFTTMIWKSATEATPGLLIQSTVRASVAFAQGKLIPPGASASAWSLAKAALKAWLLIRIMAVGTLSLIASLFALAAGLGMRVGFPSPNATSQQPISDNREAPAHVALSGDPLPKGAVAKVGTGRLRNEPPAFDEDDTVPIKV